MGGIEVRSASGGRREEYIDGLVMDGDGFVLAVALTSEG